MTLRASLLALLCASFTSGCATVLHGTTQRIRFESVPSAATASVGERSVTTPGELTLSRNSSHEVEFVKPGYMPAHSHIGQESSGAVWGNIMLGGLIGILVDTSNGAAYELVPGTVSATLIADPSVTAGSTPPAPADLPVRPAAVPDS